MSFCKANNYYSGCDVEPRYYNLDNLDISQGKVISLFAAAIMSWVLISVKTVS